MRRGKMMKKYMPEISTKPTEEYDLLEVPLNLLQVVVSAFLLGYTIGRDMTKKKEEK